MICVCVFVRGREGRERGDGERVRGRVCVVK